MCPSKQNQFTIFHAFSRFTFFLFWSWRWPEAFSRKFTFHVSRFFTFHVFLVFSKNANVFWINWVSRVFTFHVSCFSCFHVFTFHVFTFSRFTVLNSCEVFGLRCNDGVECLSLLHKSKVRCSQSQKSDATIKGINQCSQHQMYQLMFPKSNVSINVPKVKCIWCSRSQWVRGSVGVWWMLP